MAELKTWKLKKCRKSKYKNAGPVQSLVHSLMQVDLQNVRCTAYSCHCRKKAETSKMTLNYCYRCAQNQNCVRWHKYNALDGWNCPNHVRDDNSLISFETLHVRNTDRLTCQTCTKAENPRRLWTVVEDAREYANVRFGVKLKLLMGTIVRTSAMTHNY